MLTPQPAPAVAPLPPQVSINPDDLPEDELTDEEISQLEERLYYDSHDDREFWS